MKTGVFTGGHAINPVNGEQPADLDRRLRADERTAPAPSWRCRGTTQRDWEFARAFDFPIREVVAGGDVEREPYIDREHGRAVNSTTPDRSFSIDGLPAREAIETITGWLEQTGKGRARHQLQAARLAVRAPALLGRAVPDRVGGGAAARAARADAAARAAADAPTSRARPPATTRGRRSRVSRTGW